MSNTEPHETTLREEVEALRAELAFTRVENQFLAAGILTTTLALLAPSANGDEVADAVANIVTNAATKAANHLS